MLGTKAFCFDLVINIKTQKKSETYRHRKKNSALKKNIFLHPLLYIILFKDMSLPVSSRESFQDTLTMFCFGIEILF